MTAGPTVSGELPLSAFVSSLMRPELGWARRAAVEALTENPILVPWAFEFTPLSSDAADATYLRKVREADIVIWLAGAETTDPVANEIAEALAADRRLWTVLLPAEERDERTTRTLELVRPRSKYGEVTGADELRTLLALTFGDEVVRALRERPGQSRVARLEYLARASRERLVTRWQAAGLSRLEALEFADDLSVGEPSPPLLPDDSTPLRVLVADVGAGKSVVAERMLQRAIQRARQDVVAPIPIFIHARAAATSLDDAVSAAAMPLGDIFQSGAFIVVDGLDEVDHGLAARLLDEARILVRAAERIQIVMTSRPLPVVEVEEAVEVPPLDDETTRDLVSRIAGHDVTPGEASTWPPAVADSVNRPLFALLLGQSLRRRAELPESTGQLLAELAFRAAGAPSGTSSMLLRKLAVCSTDASGSPIRIADVASISEQRILRESGLVVYDGGYVEFGLPVLLQWFAAQALLDGRPTVAEVLEDRRRLDRWFYAFAIALAIGSSSWIEEAMPRIAAQEPGFAARVSDEAIERWGGRAPVRAMPDWKDAAALLRAAFEAWREGAQPVADLLLPVRKDGRLAPVAARAGGEYLEYGWYLGSEAEQEIAKLPDHLNILRQNGSDWHIRAATRLNPQPGWAWRVALEVLRDGLANVVRRRALRIASPSLNDEALWVFALEVVAKKGSLFAGQVARKDVEQGLAALSVGGFVRLRDRDAHVDDLRECLRRLKDASVEEVTSPWPAHDLSVQGGFVWNPYSDEQQLARTQAIYAAALDVYPQLVRAWFPRLSRRFPTFQTLPARLVGLYSPGRTSFEGSPTLSWYLEPLPPHESSEVDIALRDGEIGWGGDHGQRLYQRLVAARPDAAGWISAVVHHAVAAHLFQGAPLATLVYEWLADDLKSAGWGR